MDQPEVACTDTLGAKVRAHCTLSGKRILVVDDNLINLDIATEALLASGASVDSAEGGEVALKFLEVTTYDLVLLDLTMPGVDGIALGLKIRSSENNGKTPMVLFTASDASDARRAAKVINAQGLVAKPVDVEDLLRCVSKFA